MTKILDELKAISDRLSKGETISEGEMQRLIDKADEKDLQNILNYCLQKNN